MEEHDIFPMFRLTEVPAMQEVTVHFDECTEELLQILKPFIKINTYRSHICTPDRLVINAKVKLNPPTQLTLFDV